MTQEAAVPPDFWARIEQMIDRKVADQARSGATRNSSIGEGGTFTLRGGVFRLIYGAYNLLYFGPISPSLPDGTPQQGFRLRRADGSIALDTRDAFPDPDGTLNQALTWYDRAGNAVFADDTDSGQGIARPYVPGVFYLARDSDWPTVTSTTFETVYRAKMPKQQPKLLVRLWGVNDTSGATGEVRVMVNGVQLGATSATTFGTVTEYLLGPAAVAGAHMSTLVVEIQARVATGAGGVRVCPASNDGRQT